MAMALKSMVMLIAGDWSRCSKYPPLVPIQERFILERHSYTNNNVGFKL
jgi:hypothetical protein